MAKRPAVISGTGPQHLVGAGIRSAGEELLSAVCSAGLLLWSFSKQAGRLSLRLWDVGKNI